MRFKKLIVAVLAVYSAVCMAPKTLTAQQPLNNDSVIKLVKAGLSEDLIVSTINSQPGTYNTSTDGLIALKKAGVSDKVVGAVVTKGFAPAPTSSPAPASTQAASNSDDPTQVHAPGIYILVADHADKQAHLIKLDRAFSKQTKASGFFTSGLTYGIPKDHLSCCFDFN